MITDSSTSGHSEHYTHKDTLGSTDVITNAVGGVVAEMSFDAFGKRRNVLTLAALTQSQYSALNALTTQGFTGHEMVDEAGIIHMGGRIYDPGLGRFLSADPIVSDLGNVQRLNRYSYVLNSPLSYTDPTGFDQCQPEGAVSGCITGGHPDYSANYLVPPITNPDMHIQIEGICQAAGQLPVCSPAPPGSDQPTNDIGTNGNTGEQQGSGDSVTDTKSVDPTPEVITHKILGDVDTGVTRGEWDRLMAEAKVEVDALMAHLAARDAERAAPNAVLQTNLELANDGGEWTGILNASQAVLAGAGFAPVVGIGADLLNGLISVARGDWFGAGFSVLSAIPMAGDAAGAARLGIAAQPEITVYRVFGGDARAQGFSWTPINPRTVSNYRDSAGLPSGGPSGSLNTADFLIQGKVNAADVIKSKSAFALDGNRGGILEFHIDPINVRITDFSVLNP